jgi:hypothetical protein
VTPKLNTGNHLTGYVVNVTIIECDAVWLSWLVSGVKQVELEKSEKRAKIYHLLRNPLKM